MALFGNKYKDRIAGLEAQVKAMGSDIFKPLYQYLPKGIKLSRDESMGAYVKYGYEENADVFSIGNQICQLFSDVEIKAYRGETEVDDPVKAYFDNRPDDMTYNEFRYAWEMFGLITGNSIVYNQLRKLGNNAGNLSAFDQMPSQNVEIKSAGWRQPVGKYVLDLDNRYEYDPQNVWHTRFFPNLDYTDGKNFMGMSPVKVAAMIIKAQNAGYEFTEDLLRNGVPPGILSKIDEQYNKQMAQQQEDGMRRKWRRAGRNKLPLFTLGKLEYTKIGIDNLKDLQVIENSENGMRVLCNIWSVPLQAFNDQSASTYNNMKEADKAIYKKRVMPDINRYINGLNKLFKSQGITFKADYSGIESLQDDRVELMTFLDKAIKAKVLGRDEARRMLSEALKLELDELNIEGMSLEDMINEPQINTFNINNEQDDNKPNY